MLTIQKFARLTFSALCFLSTVSCLTLTAEQKQQMIKETVVETKMNKNEIFNGASGVLAKSLGDSKAAIKVSDKEEGKIISRLMRTCSFRNGGTTVDLAVTYNMTLIAKDAKYKLTLDPVEWTNGYVYPALVEDMGKCTTELHQYLVTGIEKSATEKDF